MVEGQVTRAGADRDSGRSQGNIRAISREWARARAGEKAAVVVTPLVLQSPACKERQVMQVNARWAGGCFRGRRVWDWVRWGKSWNSAQADNPAQPLHPVLRAVSWQKASVAPRGTDFQW